MYFTGTYILGVVETKASVPPSLKSLFLCFLFLPSVPVSGFGSPVGITIDSVGGGASNAE